MRRPTSWCTSCGSEDCSPATRLPCCCPTGPRSSWCSWPCSRPGGISSRSTATSRRPRSRTSSRTPAPRRWWPTSGSPPSPARRPVEAGVPESGRISVGAPGGTGGIPGFTPLHAAVAGRPDGPPADRLAGQFMQYTSGTTGRPKAVQRTLPSFDPETWVQVFSGNLLRYDIEPGGDAVHLVTSPMYHMSPLSFGYFSAHFEHPVVLMEKWDAEEALRLIERYRVSDTAMVPTQLHRLMQLPENVRARYDVSSLRQVIHAAAPCPVELKRKLFDWLGPVIYEFYGATEGGGTLAKPQDWLDSSGHGGPPVAGGGRQGARRRRERGPRGHGRHRLHEAHGWRLPLQGRRRQDGCQPARRLLHRRGHGRARRGRIPLPAATGRST